MSLPTDAQSNCDAVAPARCEVVVEVPNPQGLHTRPATLIAKVAGGFKSQVTLARDQRTANAKSTLSVLTLVAEKGAKLTVQAFGEDASQAAAAVADLVRRGFDEM